MTSFVYSFLFTIKTILWNKEGLDFEMYNSIPCTDSERERKKKTKYNHLIKLHPFGVKYCKDEKSKNSKK